MEKYIAVLDKFKDKSAGIFVDEANLFYSQKSLGWHINWRKVLEFFKQFYNFVCFEHNAAWEIRRSYHLFFEDIRDKIEFIEQKSPEN